MNDYKRGNKAMSLGQEMYNLCERIFPICRSITGDGVRETLLILKEHYPELNVCEIPSGTKVFDWTIPKEWNIRDAWIKDSKGNKIVDFQKNNLHVVGYSVPTNLHMDLGELKKIIHTQPEQPDVIPYVTSYYKERFGFCMTQDMLDSLQEDEYHVFIDSELVEGSMTYGEIIIPGNTDDEILLSTYCCHPSMANNECSGLVLTIFLANWIASMQNRRFTYRILIMPETIGAIAYINKNLLELKQKIKAGFVMTCVGDNNAYSYVASKYGDTLADKVAKNVLGYYCPQYKSYTFLQRGSDERQYNAPGVDLPVCDICRSKFHEYPEYHTSKDNMDFISPEGLQGAYDVYKMCIEVLEKNYCYMVNFLCEPQLGKRGLYPTISQKGSYDSVKVMTDFIAYADGKNDLIDISNIIGVSAHELIDVADRLLENGIIKVSYRRKMDIVEK